MDNKIDPIHQIPTMPDHRNSNPYRTEIVNKGIEPKESPKMVEVHISLLYDSKGHYIHHLASYVNEVA